MRPKASAVAAAPPATIAADPEVPISVTREGPGFRVLGDRPERWVAMTDLDNPQAVVPGTRMAYAGLSQAKQRADVIVYLRSLAANPQPDPRRTLS